MSDIDAPDILYDGDGRPRWFHREAFPTRRSVIRELFLEHEWEVEDLIRVHDETDEYVIDRDEYRAAVESIEPAHCRLETAETVDTFDPDLPWWECHSTEPGAVAYWGWDE